MLSDAGSAEACRLMLAPDVREVEGGALEGVGGRRFQEGERIVKGRWLIPQPREGNKPQRFGPDARARHSFALREDVLPFGFE